MSTVELGARLGGLLDDLGNHFTREQIGDLLIHAIDSADYQHPRDGRGQFTPAGLLALCEHLEWAIREAS